MQNLSMKKNEKFYTKKRTLLRVADQIHKQCDADIFIVVLKKDTGRLFSYSSDDSFNLRRVS